MQFQNYKRQGEFVMINKRTTLTAISFAGLLAVSQLLAQSSGPKTLTGIVSDSMCGTHHMAKDKTPAECTRMCIKQGMKYALVAGKLYTLEGHESELEKLAGQKVTVAGKLTGDTLAVSSVAPVTKTGKS
jgi:hypothetical protein